MGREAYTLKRGAGILRCLFFCLDSSATIAYPARSSPITAELLERLSADFMNIEERAAKAAQKEVTKTDLKTKLYQFGLPVVVALIGVIGTVYATSGAIQERLTKLELSLPTAQQMDARIGKIEAMSPLELRVEALEKNDLQKPSGAARPSNIPAK